MRLGSWLLLLLLLGSAPFAAHARSEDSSHLRRTLVVPARPGEVPPLRLYVAAGVATLVQLEASLQPSTLRLMAGEERVQLAPVSNGSWVLVPARNLADDELVPLTLEAEPGAEPFRIVLATLRGVVDQSVRLARARDSEQEDSVEDVARQLLAAPDSHAVLVTPRELPRLNLLDARARIESVVWMGQRLFATLSVRSRKKGGSPWRLVQVRLRVTLADGSLLEWPAHLRSGPEGGKKQVHVFTSLIPEGSTNLEVSPDIEGSMPP